MSEYNIHTLKYDLLGSITPYCVISINYDDRFMKNSLQKIQFYYEISILSEKNENFLIHAGKRYSKNVFNIRSFNHVP